MPRFDCPSFSLRLASLLTRTRKVWWTGFVLAVGIHLSLTLIGGFQQEHQAAKPLTTKFVKRAPRLTKPLEMKKRPRPKRRQMRRKMVSVEARVDREKVANRIQSLQMIQSLARPQALMSRSASFTDAHLEQEVLADALESTKDAGSKIDATLEMMDISALDTGKYHAMVIQDPSDKQSVRGFFHLAPAISQNMYIGWGGMKPRFVKAMVRLVNAMNKYTSVKTKLADKVGLDSEELLKTPWVYVMAVRNLRFTESEAKNIGVYALSGGMIFMDDLIHAPGGTGDRALREFLIAALGTQGIVYGRDWSFERLPNSHAIYHCYFDFDGPPLGVHLPIYFANWAPGNTERLADYLEGVSLGERMVVIMSNQAYANAWGDWGLDGTTEGARGLYGHLDPTRSLQFGVNVIIFALTQEGSITHQVMESVNY